MISIFLDLRLTLTDSFCKSRPSRQNCRKIHLSKEFYHFTIYISLGLLNNYASRNILCCSSCNRFCLLTKVVFDSVQVIFVNTHNTMGCLLTANSPTTRNNQADTYDFSDLLLYAYESWGLLPPYSLKMHGVSAWLIHRHNWILDELHGVNDEVLCELERGKLRYHPYVFSRIPRISRNTVSEKFVHTLKHAKGVWLVEGAGVLFRLHCCNAICPYVLYSYYFSQ